VKPSSAQNKFLETVAATSSQHTAAVATRLAAINPLALDIATLDRLLGCGQRRRYPPRSLVYSTGDPADSLYYVISGSVSLIAEERGNRELILGYFGAGEFIGEHGLFCASEKRETSLRTRSSCELAEISYVRLQQMLLKTASNEAPRLLYALSSQLSRRFLYTSRKAGRLAFLDVAERIKQTLYDLADEVEAMSHPNGIQLNISRQEIARLVGCSREMAGRVLKKLQAQQVLYARGKTIILYASSKQQAASSKQQAASSKQQAAIVCQSDLENPAY